MTLGDGSYSFTELSSAIKVGRYSSIAAGCHFHSPGDNHEYKYNKKVVYTTNWSPSEIAPEIEIGSDVWIGGGVRILPGVKIGDGAIIGAGAVVTKDVPPFAVVVGNPGKIIRFRFTSEQMVELLEMKWWNLSEEKLEKIKPFMKDIDVFLLKFKEYKKEGHLD